MFSNIFRFWYELFVSSRNYLSYKVLYYLFLCFLKYRWVHNVGPLNTLDMNIPHSKKLSRSIIKKCLWTCALLVIYFWHISNTKREISHSHKHFAKMKAISNNRLEKYSRQRIKFTNYINCSDQAQWN